MNMNLYIFPGASSPFLHDSKYAIAYTACRDLLNSMGYEARVLSYPGQLDESGRISGELRFDTSLEHCRNVIDANATPFCFLSFCYGGLIAAQLASVYRARIERGLFWAALPMWRLWRDCVLDLDRWEGSERKRGVRLTSSVVSHTIPFEVSIQSLATAPLQLAMGSSDEWIPASTLQYYASLSSFPAKLLPAVGHTPMPDDPSFPLFRSHLCEVFRVRNGA